MSFKLVITLLIGLALIAMALPIGARAHQAMSGWAYPIECCSGHDCAEIDAGTVTETVDGYVVTVLPGGHPMWRQDRARPLTLRIAHRDARQSPDGRWHLCIDASGRLLCFYAALGGS